jgi:hypothetical protein
MISHIRNVTNGQIRIKKMLAYFKINTSNQLIHSIQLVAIRFLHIITFLQQQNDQVTLLMALTLQH